MTSVRRATKVLRALIVKIVIATRFRVTLERRTVFIGSKWMGNSSQTNVSAASDRFLARSGRWLFAFVLVASALALGASRTPVLGVISVALVLCLLLVVSDAPVRGLRRGSAVVFLVGAALVLFTAVQCVPLPRSLVHVLSPHAANVWSSALAALHEQGPQFHPLTLDPPATRIELLRGTVYLLTYLSAIIVARRPRGDVFLCRVLVVASLVVACAHALHIAFGAERAYGFFKPQTAVATIGPFFNSNTLAAYINIGLAIALASVVSARPIGPRLALGAVAALLFIVEVWNASRGGVVSMVLGVLILGGRTIGGARRERLARVYWAISGMAVLAGVGMLVVGISESSFAQLADKDVSKLAVNITCFREMVPAYPLFGAGRGAFESTFPEFWTSKTFEVYTHPENIVSQWATEWGVPTTVGAFICLAVTLRPRVVIWRDSPAFGPWLACVIFVAHNLVDFSSEVPSVMIALAVCVAMVVARTGAGAKAPPEKLVLNLRPLSMVCSLASAVALIVVMQGGSHELLAQKVAIHGLLADASISDERFRDEIRLAMLSHPAEPYFPYMGAARALVTGRESAIPWIARTFSRARSYGPAHLVLARTLRRRSRSQARLEYRLAAEQGWPQATPLELASLVDSVDDANEIVPSGQAGLRSLEAIAELIGLRLPATQWRLDDEILGRDPKSVTASLRHARGGVRDVLSPEVAPWCSFEDCVREASVSIDVAERAEPTMSEPRVLRARLNAEGVHACVAVQQLHTDCAQVSDRLSCLDELSSLATQLSCEEEATQAIDSFTHACNDVDTCATALLEAARLEEKRGNNNRALAFLRNARTDAPTRTDVLEAYAAQASRAGLHTDAVEVYRQLAHVRPNRPDYQASIKSELHAINPAKD